MERLDKILSDMGFGTRKEVKKLVKSGGVTLNGVTAADSGMKLDMESCEISVLGKAVKYKKFIYLMLNKPAGYISAVHDGMHKTVTELVPEQYASYDVFPVGRLDIDTEGLLLLTNDGQLAHNLLAPKKHVPKTYLAAVEKPVTPEDIAAFEKGVRLDGGYTTMPAAIKPCKGGYLVTIYEGKYHQIKRMFKSINNKVVYLKRVKMGGLGLDESLAPGNTKELTKEELDKLWI